MTAVIEVAATWDLIRAVRADGVTVVLVSHFMDEVEELCDRVAILERGRIAALDTPAGLVDSAGAQYRSARRGLHHAGPEDRGAEPGPQADDHRTGRGPPPAGGDDRGEHRAAGSAAHPGPGGGRGRGAAADGPGDPRHAGAGPDRDHHPARGGPAEQPRG